jgi:hypothetical protein
MSNSPLSPYILPGLVALEQGAACGCPNLGESGLDVSLQVANRQGIRARAAVIAQHDSVGSLGSDPRCVVKHPGWVPASFVSQPAQSLFVI